MSVKNIQQILGLTKVRGDIGLEIEVEGRRLPRVETEVWRTERDSSLKASEAYEYVLRQPVPLAKVGKAMDELLELFKENRAIANDSYRAGIHAHVNIQDLTYMQLANFVTLSICYEGLLSEYCGESRKGNLFCLRVQDAEQTVEDWLRAFNTRSFGNQNHLKYGFVNLATVGLYGSLEFRGLNGTVDKDRIKEWCNTLIRIKEYAKTFDNPGTIIEQSSVLGYQEFLEEGCGDMARSIETTSKDFWKCIRLAQDFAYGFNWEDLCQKV